MQSLQKAFGRGKDALESTRTRTRTRKGQGRSGKKAGRKHHHLQDLPRRLNLHYGVSKRLLGLMAVLIIIIAVP